VAAHRLDHAAHRVAQALDHALAVKRMFISSSEICFWAQVALVLRALLAPASAASSGEQGVDHLEALQRICLQLQQGGSEIRRLAVVVLVVVVLVDLDFFVPRPAPRPSSSAAFGSIRPSTSSSMRISSRRPCRPCFEDLGDGRRAGGDGLIMCFRPSSMRLAISISPSRVSSSTVPISRMYMRTGSVVRPNSESTVDRPVRLLLDFVIHRRRRRFVGHQQVFGGGRLVEDLDAHVVEGGDDRFDLLGVHHVVRAGGR
jgi:hypothetical protein